MDTLNSTLVFMGLILLMGFFVYTVMHKRVRNRKPTRVPGPQSLPGFGSALQINPIRIHEKFYDYAKLYGEIFEVKLFSKTIVVLNSVNMIQKAFVRDGQIFNDRPDIYITKQMGFTGGITLRNLGKTHRFVRKTFIKSLHVYGTGLAKFEKIILGEIDRVMTVIDSHDGNGFDVTEIMKTSLINVMSILTIGERATEKDVKTYYNITDSAYAFVNPYINSIILSLPFIRHLPFCRKRIDKVNEAIGNLLEKYFHSVKKNTSSDTRQGLVQELLEVQKNNGEDYLSDDMIKSMVLLDAFSAGTTSSTSVIPNIMLCLVQNPKYQVRLQEELDEVIGRDRRPLLSDKKACVFLEVVVMETTRLLIPGPFAVPHICNQDVDFEGYRIKEGTQVLQNVWFIHHDEAIWGDPWSFRPERFLDDDGKLLPNDHKFMKNLITFGIGPRKCVGMGVAINRVFLYIATIFQKYTLIPVPGKCGSCDPRTKDFVFGLAIFPKLFNCVARKRF